MKDVVVVLTRNNARIVTNPTDLDKFLGKQNVFVNPNMEDLKGVPPHFWKSQRGRLVPMNALERRLRIRDIEKHGSENWIELIPLPAPFWTRRKVLITLSIILWLGLLAELRFRFI